MYARPNNVQSRAPPPQWQAPSKQPSVPPTIVDASRTYNPRSKEDRPWKFIEKIIVDKSLFPSHLKPAAIIIGVKGCNHSRMQDESGCCVQLRGQGISSPGTPGSDEPMHLWIKYDTPDQLEKVRSVFMQIIAESHQNAADRRTGGGTRVAPPPHPTIRTVGPNAIAQTYDNELPPKPSLAPNSPLECFYTVHYLCHSFPGILSNEFEQKYMDFFGFGLDPRLTSLGGTLAGSLAMLPQIVRLNPEPGGDAEVFRIEPVLPIGMPWQAFYTHVNRTANMAAPAPAPAAIAPPPPPPPAILTPPPNRLPSPACLIVQALHAMLVKELSSETRGTHRDMPVETLRQWPGRPLEDVSHPVF